MLNCNKKSMWPHDVGCEEGAFPCKAEQKDA